MSRSLRSALFWAILILFVGCGGEIGPDPSARFGSGSGATTGAGGTSGTGGGSGALGTGGAGAMGVAECGNGVVDSGETCDPQASCPISCDDQNACTTDVLTGNAANCNVACSYTNVVVCVNDDGCCPSSCSGANDNDCMNPSMCGGAGPGTTPLDAEEQNFLQILNQHRVANGRSAVAACTSLSRAAQGHSEDMRDQNYFDHTGLNGSSPIERACDACYASCGVTGWGENIAAGNSGAQGTFNQWVNSPGHNANMLNANFDVVGIGRATGGGTYGSYWTTVFGGQSDSSCN